MLLNYILEGGVFLEPKLSKTELMVGQYLISRQYEPGTGLGKNRDGILEPVGIKGQDTTFCLGFKPTRKVPGHDRSKEGTETSQSHWTNTENKVENLALIRNLPALPPLSTTDGWEIWSQRLQAQVSSLPFVPRRSTCRRISWTRLPVCKMGSSS